ncbi:ABC transporter permease [Thermomicrobium sp. 4228-Ro]|uniref:ABC transporter permease n=1 Tax=Thermomicrobium sp. 4228-Ro TaxID=2993937 RepID=UPI0022499BBA|nr:ABC transporter permease [Thermomicrobium sp. 4228-Ro]MCX2726803.1 ABC transporter permease [Thermomicrobium sp. 4228-Ro]
MELFWDGLVGAVQLILRGDPQLREVVWRTLVVSGCATLLAVVAGVPLGVALAVGRFPGREALSLAVNTGMGLPPVLVGLVVTILLWRSGPFGFLGLLYTPAAMILAQWIVAWPIAAGVTRTAIEVLDQELVDALRVFGAGPFRTGWELVRAALPQVGFAAAAAFGRAISEVGASIMVGGNILGQTRILTTAIVLETNRGEFALALALGFVLLALALVVNIGARALVLPAR